MSVQAEQEPVVTITLTVPQKHVASLHAIGSIVEYEANTRLTPTGAVSRSRKGEYRYTESFREVAADFATQLHEQARKATSR